jgi:predicted nucleic acid-binding protein
LARRGRPPLPRGVLSFESDGWSPPAELLLDTTIVVEALLSSQPNYAACFGFFEAVAASKSTVIFNRLLETELCEVLFNIALREQHGKRWKSARYDGRARRRAGRLLNAGLTAWGELLELLAWSRIELSEVSEEAPRLMRAHGLRSYDAVHAASLVFAGIGDFVTLDHGFAALPQGRATIHTTGARVATMRRWRGGR